jgi:hypothetical protein
MLNRISQLLNGVSCAALLIVLGIGCSPSSQRDNGITTLSVPQGSSGTGETVTLGSGQGGAIANTPPSSGASRPQTSPTCNVTPRIMYVIDGSGSMCADLSGASRWKQLRKALLEPDKGLIYLFQERAQFGMLLYDGTISIEALFANAEAQEQAGGSPSPQCSFAYMEAKAEGECPLLIKVPPKFNNAKAIDAKFPQTELGGSTPTDKAMKVARDTLVKARQKDEDREQNPEYIILATDGQPNDICVGGAGGDGTAQQKGVIAEVDAAYKAGIKTYVISLAGGDAALEAHLNEVAKHGNPKNKDARTYTPLSAEELVNALQELVNAALGCLE